MTEKENQNKNSDAAFGTTCLECFQRIKQNPYYLFFSLLRQLSTLITICVCTDRIY
jgi:hypothetical protein